MKPASRILFYYTAAFFQGICLILIPAAGFILRTPEANHISQAQYGLLFLPMILMTIFVSGSFSSFLSRFGREKIFLAALISNFLYLLFCFLTRFTEQNPAASFVLLLASNLFLGSGFGLLVSVLNILTGEAAPRHRDSALVGLHALLGVGASAAPLIVQFFYERGEWTMGVLLTSGLGIGLLPFALTLSREKPEGHERTAFVSLCTKIFPLHAKLFLLVIFIYGIIESIVGNWSTAYLMEAKRFSPAAVSSALATFWFFIMAGRVLSALLSFKIKPEWIYRILPLMMAAGLWIMLRNSQESRINLIYILTGLGCSAYFPLSVSLPSGYFQPHRERLASLGIAALMVGVGVGTSLLGFFFDRGWLALEHSIGIALSASLSLLVLSWFIAKPLTNSSASADNLSV